MRRIAIVVMLGCVAPSPPCDGGAATGEEACAAFENELGACGVECWFPAGAACDVERARACGAAVADGPCPFDGVPVECEEVCQ